ncbi:class I SAM-dependent DNA methyltransferase [Rhodospirillum sp. A1_3_36]|uniref:class I SAM-dependent DNA methyltransferase n=1 Tax=Rhodospirillum sp. A1_3_36 TaxID=3391666 RepID=UPI0039A5D42F
MFSASVDLYDDIYLDKDYRSEARLVTKILRQAAPGSERLLDVGCGTGEHIRHLVGYGFEIDGVDIDGSLLALARAKNPDCRFYRAGMTEFQIPLRYDAILCMFSAVGYVRTADKLRITLANFRSHLTLAGIVILEPWVTPDQAPSGKTTKSIIGTGGKRIRRSCTFKVDNGMSVINMKYEVDEGGQVRSFSEEHRLGLFSREEMHAAFADLGFRTRYLPPSPLLSRGLYLGQISG